MVLNRAITEAQTQEKPSIVRSRRSAQQIECHDRDCDLPCFSFFAERARSFKYASHLQRDWPAAPAWVQWSIKRRWSDRAPALLAFGGHSLPFRCKKIS
jgi:hypothetical protein